MKQRNLIFTGILSLTLFFGGYQFIVKPNIINPQTNIKDKTQSTIDNEQGNNQFWNSENVFHLQVLGIKESALTVRIPAYAKIPDYDRIEEGWKIFNMGIDHQTLIWEDGELVRYSQSAGLSQGDFFSVLALEQGSKIIAREIYGPVIQVWGRIEKVSEGHLVVEELKYTQSPDTLKKPTGRTLNMLYDSRTNFRPECTSDSLKPDVIIQSTAVGRVPGRLLIQGISVYKEPTH